MLDLVIVLLLGSGWWCRTSTLTEEPRWPPSGPPPGSALRFAYGSATRRSRRAFVHHVLGVRHVKLTIAGEWKSHPAKAVAGGSEPSLAGVAATRGLKRRQGSYGVWERASKGGRSRRPSAVPYARRQHVPPRYARGGRFAGVDGHITYGRQSSEHERPDRGRRIGPRRGARTRHCRSPHSS